MIADMIGGHPGLAWLVGGLLLMAVEALAPGAFMVWIGLAAVGTGLATLAFPLDFSFEVVVFAVLAAASIASGLRLRRSARPNTLNTPQSGLVGRTVQVLSVQGREGRVRMGDSDWSARLDAGAAWAEQGRLLEVVALDGCVLVVRPRAERS
jgi:membrane protein implicated in regulation of membrane protease activity